MTSENATLPWLCYLGDSGAALVSMVNNFLFNDAASVLYRLDEIRTLSVQFMWNGWAELNGMKQSLPLFPVPKAVYPRTAVPELPGAEPDRFPAPSGVLSVRYPQ